MRLRIGGDFRNEVDLNRNFPDQYRLNDNLLLPQGTEQPETLALMDWITHTSFVGSGNLHEGAVVANYPWDAAKTKSKQCVPQLQNTNRSVLHVLLLDGHGHQMMRPSCTWRPSMPMRT